MGTTQKRILIITADAGRKDARASHLLAAGYGVSMAQTADEAIALLDADDFDLVLIGRRSRSPSKPVEQELRERYPTLLVLKIAEIIKESSQYPARMTIPVPADVLAALKGMLPGVS